MSALRLPSLPALLGGLAVLSWSPAALAGGIGLFGNVGGHGDRVYYYQENAVGEFDQMPPQDQFNPNYGGGLEVILGDKDNKILGIFRLGYNQDAPEQAPADPEKFTFAYREEPRDVMMINAGLQFGVIGDPERIQGNIIGTIGSGFLTVDQTEFIQAELGIGGSYMAARKVQIAAWATGGARYRKRFYPQANGYVGIRYLFD